MIYRSKNCFCSMAVSWRWSSIQPSS